MAWATLCNKRPCVDLGSCPFEFRITKNADSINNVSVPCLPGELLPNRLDALVKSDRWPDRTITLVWNAPSATRNAWWGTLGLGNVNFHDRPPMTLELRCVGDGPYGFQLRVYGCNQEPVAGVPGSTGTPPLPIPVLLPDSTTEPFDLMFKSRCIRRNCCFCGCEDVPNLRWELSNGGNMSCLDGEAIGEPWDVACRKRPSTIPDAINPNGISLFDTGKFQTACGRYFSFDTLLDCSDGPLSGFVLPESSQFFFETRTQPAFVKVAARSVAVVSFNVDPFDLVIDLLFSREDSLIVPTDPMGPNEGTARLMISE